MKMIIKFNEVSNLLDGEGEGSFKRKYLSEKIFILSGVIGLIGLCNMLGPIKIIEFSKYIAINDNVDINIFLIIYVLSYLLVEIVKKRAINKIAEIRVDTKIQIDNLVKDENKKQLSLASIDEEARIQSFIELLNLMFSIETIVIALYFANICKIKGFLAMMSFLIIIIKLYESVWFHYYYKEIKRYQV